jgi:hypothetical protein
VYNIFPIFYGVVCFFTKNTCTPGRKFSPLRKVTPGGLISEEPTPGGVLSEELTPGGKFPPLKKLTPGGFISGAFCMLKSRHVVLLLWSCRIGIILSMALVSSFIT